ncbi:MAG: hypothetical protein HF975_04540 [ANME-2 cluster archaeon]|nr:hypothetical protein [ANME-2 cluster archaeon]
MSTTEIAELIGIFILTVSTISGVVIWYLNLRLKPISKRLTELEEQHNDIEETMSLIVDGLLDNDQIPRTR